MTNNMKTTVEDREMILERVFDAPRELVFKLHTDAEYLSRWWGPKGWILPVCNIDFRPGGVWHYCMRCIDEVQGDFYGHDSWGKAVYKEIVAPERIVYVDYFTDAEGNVAEGMPEAVITLTFTEHKGKAKMISRSRYETNDAVKSIIDMGAVQGMSETWDRLDHLLKQLQ
ncbi:ATPase [Bacillus sp. T33-2]|nr:ATPase [Bacillus sp. T33-2]